MTKDFKFPTLRMPTPDEHREVSLKWLARVQPTLIDRWPPELAALSMPTKLVKLDVDAVWEGICDVQDGKGIGPALVALASELDAALGWDRHFIRLNSRSPKDWPWPFEVPATISGKEAVSILASSMRVLDDLMEFRWIPEQPAYVCLREFVPWVRGVNEFRCFVKDGKLIAVSHYDYTKPVPESVAENAGEIRATIDNYYENKLKSCLPIETVVFDVALDYSGDLLLIEINSYGFSDPCWFGSYEAVEAASTPLQFTEPA